MSKQNNLLVFLVFLILGFAIYGMSVSYPFWFVGDRQQIYENLLLTDISSFASIKWLGAWRASTTPIVYNIWQAITGLFGLRAPHFHLLNILVHVGNAFLLYQMIRRFLVLVYQRERAVFETAVVIGFLFLIFPLHVPTVVVAASFPNILVCTFAIASILAYLFSLKPCGDKIESELSFYTLATVLWLIGAFVKRDILVLPFLFLLLDFCIFKVRLAEVFNRNFFAILSSLMIGGYLEGRALFEQVKTSGLPLFDASISSFELLTSAMWLYLNPFGWSLFYDNSVKVIVEDFNAGWAPLFFYLLVGGLFFVTFFLRHKRQMASVVFLFLMMLIMFLLPKFFLIFAGKTGTSSIFENQILYYPSIAFFFLLAALINCLLVKRYEFFFKHVKFVFIFFLLAATYSWQQVFYFANPIGLFYEASQEVEGEFQANLLLGRALYEKPDFFNAKKVLASAQKIDPKNPDVYAMLLDMAAIEKEDKDGFEFLNELAKNKVEMNLNLLWAKGKFVNSVGQFREAQNVLTSAIILADVMKLGGVKRQIQADFTQVLYNSAYREYNSLLNLGKVSLDRKDVASAFAFFEAASKAKPEEAEAKMYLTELEKLFPKAKKSKKAKK